MKILPICVLIGICFIMRGSSETINCYVCDDCDVLDDSQLKTCPLQDSTNSSPVTNDPTTLFTDSTTQSTDESTQSTDESTSGISTSSPLEIISTTVSPKPTQVNTDSPQSGEPITETPKPEMTTVEQATNQPTTIAEEKQTTATNSPETEISPNSIVESAETSRPITNGNLEAFKPLSEITTNITEPVAPEASAPMINLPTAAQSVSFNPMRVNYTAPASIVQPSQFEQPYPIFNRLQRGIRNKRSAPTYHCYSIVLNDGDSKKVKKGCLEVPEEKGACDILENEFGKPLNKCKICTKDKCNNSSTLKYSILLTLIMVLGLSFY